MACRKAFGDMPQAHGLRTAYVARRSRRLNGRRRRGGMGIGVKIAIALPILLFLSLVFVGLLGFAAVVGAYGYFSQGLADPKQVLSSLDFTQQSIIYDRTGKVELARFGDQKREVVEFKDVPAGCIDAVTSIEDKTFWTNTGFDPIAILQAAIESLQGRGRGASSITQQLVRARLLDPDLVNDPSRVYERKIKEIIQSVRLSEAYPGQAGKEEIMATYLNQNFYGNNSYGIKAAAKSYFGVSDLKKLTLAQCAILAGLPQSPSEYDLVRNGVPQADGTLVVPPDSAIVQRRNYILDLMKTRSVLTAGQFTDADYEAAKREPVVVVSQKVPNWVAPHFVWQVRRELADRICGTGVETCARLEQGGLRVVATLDLKVQKVAEKWVKAAALIPNAPDPVAAAKALNLQYLPWMQKLRGKNVHNGALIAIDYQTGEVIAYVGSADYYAAKSTKAFQPQFDVLSDGWRQAGSAFKPFNYTTGLNDRTMTAATMFMDVLTDFGGYQPTDADEYERGPLRMRQAIQFSLNIPAVKALQINGVDHVFEMARKFGLRFNVAQPTAGLSLTLGTQEVHPADLAQGYATLANNGRYIGRTTILSIKDTSGRDVVTPYKPPAGVQVVSPQAAYIMTDILKGNTNPSVNPYWGAFKITNASGTRRPAALKTGTNNEARDLIAAGYIAPPTTAARAAGAYALAVVAWNGNSDYTMVSDAAHPIFSFDVPTYVWQGFINEASRKWPITDFSRPTGIVEATVDAWSGLRPGKASTKTVTELFIKGTQPGQVDNLRTEVAVEQESGLLWQDGCAGTRVTEAFLDLGSVESGYPAWQAADQAWVARARKGTGVRSKEGTRTSYFYNPFFQPYGASWGAPFAPTEMCQVAPVVEPFPTEPPLPTEPPFPTEPPYPGESLFPTEPPAPTENPYLVVPNVTGMTVANAIATLQGAGLDATVVGSGKKVTGQSPPAGTTVPPGTSIKLNTNATGQ